MLVHTSLLPQQACHQDTATRLSDLQSQPIPTQPLRKWKIHASQDSPNTSAIFGNNKETSIFKISMTMQKCLLYAGTALPCNHSGKHKALPTNHGQSQKEPIKQHRQWGLVALHCRWLVPKLQSIHVKAPFHGTQLPACCKLRRTHNIRTHCCTTNDPHPNHQSRKHSSRHCKSTKNADNDPHCYCVSAFWPSWQIYQPDVFTGLLDLRAEISS